MSKTFQIGSGLIPFPIAFLLPIPIIGLFSLLSAPPANSTGVLNHQDYKSLIHLNFPQSERAMISRYGQPWRRSDHYDWYKLDNRGYVGIAYVGRRAQSFRVMVK